MLFVDHCSLFVARCLLVVSFLVRCLFLMLLCVVRCLRFVVVCCVLFGVKYGLLLMFVLLLCLCVVCRRVLFVVGRLLFVGFVVVCWWCFPI